MNIQNFKGTVTQIEKALINNRLRVAKVQYSLQLKGTLKGGHL